VDSRGFLFPGCVKKNLKSVFGLNFLNNGASKQQMKQFSENRILKLKVMKTKALMIAVLLGLTTVAMAQPKENEPRKAPLTPKHEMRMEHRNGGLAATLELTDVQREAFKQSRLAMQKQLQPIQNELGEAEAHQKTLMSAEKPDLAAINKNIEKIGSLKVEMAKVKTKNRLDMRAQLTEEQRLKFDALKGKMKEGMREGNGMRNFREMPGREKHDLE